MLNLVPVRVAVMHGGEAGKAMALRLRALAPAEDGWAEDAADARPCPACRMLAGDVNLDGAVDAADLDEFLSGWDAHDEAVADLDRDGDISPSDLARLLDAIHASGSSKKEDQTPGR